MDEKRGRVGKAGAQWVDRGHGEQCRSAVDVSVDQAGRQTGRQAGRQADGRTDVDSYLQAARSASGGGGGVLSTVRFIGVYLARSPMD